MCFAGFLRVKSILGMSMFREPCSHQDEEQPDTELSSGSFLLYNITLLIGVVERKRIVEGAKRGKLICLQ